MSIEKLKKCYIGDAGCVVEGWGVEINTAYAYIGASHK